MVSESEDVVKEHLVRIYKGEAEKWIAESFEMNKADFASTHLTATVNDSADYMRIYITEEKLEPPAKVPQNKTEDKECDEQRVPKMLLSKI